MGSGLKLPLTVTAVTDMGGGLYAVTVAYADGTTGTLLIPDTLATVDAVRISALAMGTLSGGTVPMRSAGRTRHQRYAPRT